MSTALELAPERRVARALDLTGPLQVPAEYAAAVVDISAEDRDALQEGLKDIIRTHTGDLCEIRFRIGDAAIAWLYLEEQSDRPSDRGGALCELANRAEMKYEKLQQYFAVARAFPPADRLKFKDKPWTWFTVLACRSALDSERWGESRQERIRSLAEECRDENTRETRERVERATGKTPRVQASLVNQDDSRERLDAVVETDQTHGFVDEFRQPECPAPDDGLRALVQSLQRDLDDMRRQMQAFGEPVDQEALIDVLRDGYALELLREEAVEDAKCRRYAQRMESRVRKALNGLVVVRKAGVS